MIWRMARRTVAAAIVGGNCNIDEMSEAIWAEETIQSTALLPVLRLMALRDMKVIKKVLKDLPGIFFYPKNEVVNEETLYIMAWHLYLNAACIK
jgi:hypothetical protein